MPSRRRTFAVCLLSVVLVCAAGQTRARAQAQPAASQSGIDVSALDRASDPCNDFYQFACGGWLASHPLPPDRPRYGRFEELQDRNDAILHDILEAAAKAPAGANRQIGDYYASCMDEPGIEKKGLSPAKADLDRIAAAGSASELPAPAAFLHGIGTQAFFSFGALPDFKDAAQVIATAGQGGMGLPDRDYYLKTDENSTKLREAYVQHVARMQQLAGSTPDAAAREAQAVVRVETALARRALDRVSRRVPANLYHKMSLEEAVKLVPAFNLAAYLRALDAPPVRSINLTEPEFMKALNDVVASTPLADLKTYLRWQYLHANAALLPKAFVDENFAFYGKMLTGAQEQRDRWKRCVTYTDGDLGEALGKAYVERTFGAEGKARTLAMVQAIEAALGRDIQSLAWMSDQTKQQAEAKLRGVANKIGYPDRWRDYSSLRIARGDALGNSLRANTFEFRRQLGKIGKPVDKAEWGMTPPTVNAYYNPFENNINFPAGILQPPFFNKTADDAVNFGAAGAVVGHELTHGFDDQGRQFDAQGNLRDWWTPEDGKAFEERAACVANQYSGYTAVADVKVNGRLTLGENVADNGGLRLGWMALMETLKQKPLTAADGFPPEQRFFIGWAQMWCENRSDAVARLHAQTNPHAPGQYRTNGVVSNFPEFQKAFSCGAEGKMVNAPTCRVW